MCANPSNGTMPKVAPPTPPILFLAQTQEGTLPAPVMYEQIDFSGWFGLVLAVQQQPVVVNVAGDADSSCPTQG